jgi:regulator of sigma E protease
MLTPLIFLLILSLLVFVHEAGHFLAAKRSGIYVEEFGFGYPPRLFSIKKGETIYSINALPFGGFVRLFGEEEAAVNLPLKKSGISAKRAFYGQSPLRKAIIISAGVTMNFLLAIIAFSIAYSVSGIPAETERVKVVEIASDSPAAAADFQEHDQITAMGVSSNDLVTIRSTTDFLDVLNQNLDQQLFVQIQRGMLEFLVPIQPRSQPPEGQGPLGITISSVEMKFYPWWQMPFRGALEGLKEALAWGSLVIRMLGITFANLITRGQLSEGVAGPIEIYRITGQVVQFGAIAVLRFLGILSVNLAVVNILPLPVLDGGRLVFVFIEAIRGKRPDPNLERTINTIGMTFLIILLLLITMNDIIRIFGKDALFSKLSPFLPL